MSDRIILHVEDDSDVAFFIQRAISRAGLPFSLVRVSDGNAALEHLSASLDSSKPDEKAPYHAVILDLKLPGKDGFKVMQWIREQPRGRDLPVIVLTSSDRPEDQKRAESLGATTYLNKSVTYKNLIEFLSGMT